MTCHLITASRSYQLASRGSLNRQNSIGAFGGLIDDVGIGLWVACAFTLGVRQATAGRTPLVIEIRASMLLFLYIKRIKPLDQGDQIYHSR